jgi:hypothetical protein
VQTSAEPSNFPEFDEGLFELCRVQPKLFNFFCIIPIVLQKFSLSMKNSENFDAKELLEVPLNKRVKCSVNILLFSLFSI